MSLVLDGSDGTSDVPVDGGSKVGGVEHDGLLGSETGLWGDESVHGLDLLWGSIGEVVDSEGPGLTGGVVSLDLSKLSLEEVGSEVELSNGSVGSSVFSNEVDEVVVLRGHELSELSGGGGSDDGGGGEFHKKKF